MTFELTTQAVRQRTEGLVHETLSDDELAECDARMLWSAIIEPGDSLAGALVASLGARRSLEVALGGDDALRLASVADQIDGGVLAAGRRRWKPRLHDAPQASDAARRSGVGVVFPDSDVWPQALDDLGEHAPLCLWIKGDPSVLPATVRSVALVGARAASAYGEHVVSQMSADLCASDVAIVSGGAYGIDGMAHRAAIAAGGVTVAWLAGGVDRPYPSGHRELLDRVVNSGGAVIADVPCSTAPTKWRFLARNRLIAAMSAATVVVEAGWRSGSLNTAGHAASLGRPLGAVPGPVTSASSAGTHRLMREYGAQCVTSADDVRELMGFTDTSRAVFDDAMAQDLVRVRDALSVRTARSLDDIARRCGMSTAEVEAALGVLALESCVERSWQGWRATSR